MGQPTTPDTVVNRARINGGIMLNLTFNKARFETKMGDYAVGSVTDLAETACHQRTQEYRRLAGSRMVAIGKDDIRRKLPEAEYHVSRKVDGEITVLAFDGKQAMTV